MWFWLSGIQWFLVMGLTGIGMRGWLTCYYLVKCEAWRGSKIAYTLAGLISGFNGSQLAGNWLRDSWFWFETGFDSNAHIGSAHM